MQMQFYYFADAKKWGYSNVENFNLDMIIHP